MEEIGCKWQAFFLSLKQQEEQTMWQIFFFSFSIQNYTEKTVAPHSSTLAWKIPWMEEPGRLQSIGSLRVRHD